MTPFVGFQDVLNGDISNFPSFWIIPFLYTFLHSFCTHLDSTVLCFLVHSVISHRSCEIFPFFIFFLSSLLMYTIYFFPTFLVSYSAHSNFLSKLCSVISIIVHAYPRTCLIDFPNFSLTIDIWGHEM